MGRTTAAEALLALVVLLCSSATSQAQTCTCDKIERLKLTNAVVTDKSGNTVGQNTNTIADGKTTLVAMHGAKFLCEKLPITITIDMAELKHVSTVTVRACT